MKYNLKMLLKDFYNLYLCLIENNSETINYNYFKNRKNENEKKF